MSVKVVCRLMPMYNARCICSSVVPLFVVVGQIMHAFLFVLLQLLAYIWNM